MRPPETTILLIEDEEPHAELIQRAFEELGGEVRIIRARSLAEARAHLAAHTQDLIIADWRLPDGESMELLSNHYNPLTTPVILMTSYGNERIAVEALRSGALDYVVKSPESMLDMPHFAERAIEQWQARAERAHMQKALLDSEAQFRLLAENASDMISRHGIDGAFLYVSPASQAILGYAPDQLIGRNSLDLVHPDDLPAIRKAISENRPGASASTVLYRALHMDGRYVWLETSARPVLDEGGGSVLEIQATSRDVTARKLAEEELQLAHRNLQEAYERTIEGWVHALDLRDRETEGHTQRVTEVTLRIARTLGFTEEQLVHIRRGALLHDMGKMAIPDEILQKAGPLNQAEWEQMRRHPVYTLEMLSPIAYLRPALEIPYNHHERWDGSGYPRGLKGDQIPVSARLFAIVDVYDALTNDRPYRKALPAVEALDFLRKQAGRLFDPDLVNLFVSFVAGP